MRCLDSPQIVQSSLDVTGRTTEKSWIRFETIPSEREARMKIVIHPDTSAQGQPVLDVYMLEPGSTNAGPPDAQIPCGDVWLGSSYQSDFVIDSGGRVYCLIEGKKIIRFSPPLAPGSQPEILYEHSSWIRRLALRTVQGKARLYFSASTPGTPADPNRHKFYWLDENGTAHLYWEVGKTELQVPNPCQPGEDVALFYAGDFTFRENRLFLSNGNSIPCGVFRVAGALPDEVTGTPTRIFQTDAYAMSHLQYDGDGGLLFTEYSTDPTTSFRLRRFDLETKSTEIIWNAGGTPFRSFAVYPEASFQMKYPFIKTRRIVYLPKDILAKPTRADLMETGAR
jgi:hypothetical protein